ncbi:hypothetical protein F2P81_024992 [Scophthalmus maximus]|uniref:Uncharacterized protein n=1 Tax=Scophthalmus maximus TaxID=52904 RepID=A0A6A4RV34_SCOMX|nr:hypothetical protein F2P81_024992 [Scophthalmus maximus]
MSTLDLVRDLEQFGIESVGFCRTRPKRKSFAALLLLCLLLSLLSVCSATGALSALLCPSAAASLDDIAHLDMAATPSNHKTEGQRLLFLCRRSGGGGSSSSSSGTLNEWFSYRLIHLFGVLFPTKCACIVYLSFRTVDFFGSIDSKSVAMRKGAYGK